MAIVSNSSSTLLGVQTGDSTTSLGNIYYDPNIALTTTGTNINFGTLTLNNKINNMNQQVKVAVFHVTRNRYNEIKSSNFIQEMWIEKKPGISVDFAVATKLSDIYDASEIVIKEIFTVTL
jgi:hypothetical protein